MSISYFYPRTIKAIVIAISDLFSGLVVYNYDNSISGTTSASGTAIQVPLKFGPQDKNYLERKEGESGQRYYTQLPEFSIILKDLQYDRERASGVNEFRFFKELNTPIKNLDSYFEDVKPTPYNLNFELRVRTNSLDHTCQIFEQILPIFNPSITLQIKEFRNLNIERDIRVKLDGSNLDFQEPMTQDDRREIKSTMNLTVEAFLYKPITTAKIIKEIIYKQYINHVTVSGADSNFNFLVSEYRTSGSDVLSASFNSNQYDTSAYDPITQIYTFTSASSYT